MLDFFNLKVQFVTFCTKLHIETPLIKSYDSFEKVWKMYSNPFSVTWPYFNWLINISSAVFLVYAGPILSSCWSGWQPGFNFWLGDSFMSSVVVHSVVNDDCSFTAQFKLDISSAHTVHPFNLWVGDVM